MIKLGHYLLQNRLYTGLIVLLSGVLLAFGWPFIAWFGLLIMALVTLRFGAKEGLSLLLVYVLPELTLMVLGKIAWLLSYELMMAVVIWALAVRLRKTGSWA